MVRLNEKLYDEEVFQNADIEVHDMEYPDGSCPSMVSVSRSLISILRS